MSFIELISKIRDNIDPPTQEDLKNQETFILSFEEKNEKLFVHKAEDLGVDSSSIMNMMDKNEDLKVDGKILKILFFGDEKKIEEKYVHFLKKLNEEKADLASSEQNAQISSSQEESFIPQKRVKRENIKKRMKLIKDLVQQIEKDLDDSKETGKDVRIETSTVQKINLEPTLTSKDKEISLKQDLIKTFQVKLAQRRNSFDWIKMVNLFQVPGVEKDKMKAIQRTLTSGSKLHGPVIRGIAKYLFGEKKLMETYLFNPRGKSYLTKQGQRFKIFSPQEEKDLKSILDLIDNDLFGNQDAWHYLVRAPINQQGLDLKRDSKKKNSKNINENATSSCVEDAFFDEELDLSQYEIED